MDLPASMQQAVAHAQQGRIKEAIAILEAAVAQHPESAQAPGLLGTLLLNSGRPALALAHLQRARELAPDQAHLAVQLGVALTALERPLDGLPHLQRAVELAPAWIPGLLAFARTLQGVGDFDRAQAAYERALAADPRSADAAGSLAGMFIVSGRIPEAVELFRRTARQHPDHADIQGRLLSALNYAGDATPEEIFEVHQRWGRLIAARGTETPAFANSPDPDRRLRVGLLSTDLWDHSCAYFIRPILRARDPARLEFICYSASTNSDWMTRELQASADAWRTVAGLDERTLIDVIRNDAPDILIELSGHTAHGPLGALRLRAAPVQAMYLGDPNTTGLPTIDWRLVDGITDPPGGERFSTERLARIEGCFLCYSGAGAEPLPSREPAGPMTFGSFNSIRKLGPDVIRLWSAVLRAVPDSRLLIKTRGIATPAARRTFTRSFSAEGIDPARLDLRDGIPDKSRHLALYHQVNIALDTFPYNGTTTTCEALWMGVPVVCLDGSMHAGRVGASLLNAAGLPDLLARNSDQFISIAAGLAGDAGRLADARTRARRVPQSSLCDEHRFADRFERALRRMWRDWCSRAAAT